MYRQVIAVCVLLLGIVVHANISELGECSSPKIFYYGSTTKGLSTESFDRVVEGNERPDCLIVSSNSTGMEQPTNQTVRLEENDIFIQVVPLSSQGYSYRIEKYRFVK